MAIMKYDGDDEVQVGIGGLARWPESWRVCMHEAVFELEEFVVKGIGGGLMECSFNTEKSQLHRFFLELQLILRLYIFHHSEYCGL